MQLNQVTVSTTDYVASVDFYKALGLKLIVESPPRYARFECPAEAEQGPPATFSISHSDEPVVETGHPACYFETARMDEVVANMASLGYDVVTSAEDKSWGWIEADLRDPSGNIVRIYWAGENRRFPPWRVTAE